MSKKTTLDEDRAIAALRRKKKAYDRLSVISYHKGAGDRYLRSREGKEYIEYVKLCNTAKSEVRKAVHNYEKDIASKAQ